MYKLTQEGKKYLENGLPEIQLIKKINKKTSITDVDMENLDIGLQWAKKKEWIKISKGTVYKKKEPKKYSLTRSLEKINKNKKVSKKNLHILVDRKLIKEVRQDIEKKAKKYVGKKVDKLAPSLIQTGLWKKVKFKKYNIGAHGKKINLGKQHVLSFYINKIKNIFIELGFEEVVGPMIESSFWNFDALYQPQDHPARDLADTFYMKNPQKADIPKKIAKTVGNVHKNGGNTGSSGWKYKWSNELAKTLVMRTHTTAVSARSLTRVVPPAKVFSIGRVFRNETIDYKHLPEFTQIEGIVIDENVSFRDLLGFLKEFYKRMGFKKVRFRPAYFPYTEMSTEPEVYFEEKDEWLELGGSGIFRPEVTIPLGIDEPVLAWGLGLERLIMLKHGISDIRNFYYQNDLKLLREITWP